MPRIRLSVLLFLLLVFPAAAQTSGAQTSSSQCPDDMGAYADSSEVVTCHCPATQMGAGSVWGTDSYTADSATCRAAQHAGVLNRQGGTVTVEMLPGQPRYPGTTHNGVQSINFGTYGASYRFQGEPRRAQPAPEAAQTTTTTTSSQCPDDMASYADTSEVVSCHCPATQMGQGSVWGTDSYTADSATCSAAQHAGVVSRQGGPVTAEMLPGQPRYPGTTRNGVQSVNFGAYGASYRFQGEARRPQSAAAVPGRAAALPRRHVQLRQ